MNQLLGYAGVALLVILGMRLNRPEVHPEPPPPTPAAVVAQADTQPQVPEVVNAPPAAPQGG